MTPETNDSGPAFPADLEREEPGMTLRDYFAAKAAQGEIAASSGATRQPDVDEVASYAYRVADAMLKARATAQQPPAPVVPDYGDRRSDALRNPEAEAAAREELTAAGVDRGARIVRAIKAHRSVTGWSLRESKDAVDMLIAREGLRA